MHKENQKCTELINWTINSLSGAVVTHLVAVQKVNLEVSIHDAIKQ